MTEHIDTTNICDLPIVNRQPENNNEEVIQNIPLTNTNRQHDKETIVNKEKQVRFNENVEYENNKREEPKTSGEFVLTIEYKIIILATFFFFVFNDTKFKKYILNIMVQIFGKYLKTELGLMNKMGMFMYSLFYGLLLVCCVRFIDLTSFHLAF